MSARKIYAVVVRSGVAAMESISTDLRVMQAIVGGYIDAVPLHGEFAGLTMWVNDEGRYTLPARPCPLWDVEPTVAGDYFITRIGRNGETKGLTVADIEKVKRAFDEVTP